MPASSSPVIAVHDSVAHLSPAERAARGRAARAEVPRSSHAAFDTSTSRRDPLEILQLQAESRVPELVPLRYARMAANPFAFYRGAAAVMASDLAGTPRSGLNVQACGDAHLVNFGLFFTPERSLVFDMNDFDETLPGPWEWDVKRLCASMTVASRANGFSDKEARQVTEAAARGYRTAITQFSTMNNLEVWYAKLEMDEIVARASAQLDARRVKALKGIQSKAVSRDNLQAFGKFTVEVNGEPRFASMPPLIVPVAELVTPEQAKQLNQFARDALRGYRSTLSDDRRRLVEQFQLVDVARKVVGVGSVGTRAWMALMLGRDSDDPLVLQIKQAQASVLEPYVGRSRYEHAGRRVVAGQKLMQAASDIFLGWHRAEGFDDVSRDFYFRQLRDGKGGFDPTVMRPEGLSLYGQVCAWTLARAHARSGDAIAISAYLGKSLTFDKAIVAFSQDYADQTERDHAALIAAIESGAIVAADSP